MVATTPVNLLDWQSVYGFRLTPAVLAAVDIPSLALWGRLSHPAARRANALLGQCIRHGSVASIPGAAHFMISTHAAQVAGPFTRHITARSALAA
jgi:hypothetical protein